MATIIKNKTNATFSWRGTNKQGKPVTGEMAATSTKEVENRLRKMGVISKKVVKQRTSGGKMKKADISVFTRQLYTMLKAGVPMTQSFDIIAGGSEKPVARRLAFDIRDSVQAGSSLADAFRKYPQYFDNLYCNLVAAGELSGTLETMLDRLATYMEKSEAVKAQIKSALMYPIIVLTAAFSATAAILIFVVPTFVDMFNNFDADLPALTQLVVDLSDFFVANWYFVFGGIGLAIFSFSKALKTSEAFHYWWDSVMLKMPIFGILVRKSCWARWAQTAATMFAAGVPLVDALAVVAGASGNLVFEKATKKIQTDVEAGGSLTASMSDSEIFPPMMLQMCTIGEQSGQLEDMLDRVAGIYEKEVDVMVAGMSSMMEPLIIIIVGGLIGGIVVAMYLPIIMMGTAL